MRRITQAFFYAKCCLTFVADMPITSVMSKKSPNPGKSRSGAPSDDREARLAEALRANLRRRKAAAKTQKSS
tara:strand:- start:323 stop:538 length:216 start_codon:yes stop_codon:yes gene_type:complete